MKKLFRFLKDYKKESFLAPFFKLLEAVFDLLVPIVIRFIVNDGIGKGNKTLIWQLSLLMVGFGVLGLICAVIAQYFAAKAAVGFATGLRSALFSHIQKLSYSETDRIGTSTLITRMSSDINQLQNGVNMVLRLFLRSPIIVFGSMIAAFLINTRAGTVFAVTIPVLAVVVFGIMLGTIPLYRKVQSLLDRVTGVTRENLNGVRVVRAFNKEKEETEAFRRANEANTGMQNFVGKISALMNPLTYAILNLGVVVLMQVCSLEISNGTGLTDGDVLALYNYMGQILVELIKLANTIFTVTKAAACGSRISSVLDLPVGMETLPLKGENVDKSGARVRFNHASIAYGGAAEESLSDIELTARPGDTVGIIGGTGSGKTTLVNLIPRFYDVTRGHVYVDGQDVRTYDTETLRQKIGVVPQKAVLFKGTIRSNLLWGNDKATDEELWAALDTAQAKEFVEAKPGGLDAPVEQNGRNFSGGQRQRLTIARALVRRPEILILDDSASALDFATDAKLRKALRSLDYSPTVFIISQRTSSIRSADHILVLDDGRTVGAGTHDELLRDCPVYEEIHSSQYKKEGGMRA